MPAPRSTSISRVLLPQMTWRGGLASSLHPTGRSGISSRTHHQLIPQYRSISTRSTTTQPTWRQIAQTSRQRQTLLSRTLYAALLNCSHPSTPSPSALLNGGNLPQSSSRPFSSSRPCFRDHHFDTLKFVQRLKDEGFSEEQATAMMRVLSDVIEESIQNLTRTMVLREDAERATYTQKVDFTKLRSELLNTDSAETAVTRATHERLTNDLAKLSARLRDEVSRTQASVRLDLNLEKGRIREEANTQELKIKETEARIEQEVAGLRERVEQVKFSTLQWLMGVCTGTAALILGAWRLFM